MKEDQKYKKANFNTLAVGDTFYVWGDQFINYEYPKWCECIKDNNDTAHEVDGVSFLIGETSEVNII